jgi:endonuclease I
MVVALVSCTVDFPEPRYDGGSGDPMTGDPATGDTNAGDPMTGDPTTGDTNAGDPMTGDPTAGDPMAGDPMAGDPGSTDLAAHIVSFAVPWDLEGRAADGGDVWVDIRINDASALGSSWRLMMATYTYVVEQLNGSQVPWSLQDGDLLRFHGPAYTGGNDTVMSDNNADRWDVRGSESFGLNIKHGFIWIEDSSAHMLDGVVYETNRNDLDWLGGAALAALGGGVGNGLWNSTAQADAFFLSDADIEYGRLVNPSQDGSSAADWVARGSSLPDYYADAIGKTGAELKVALHMAIKGHTVVAYADLTSAFRVTDRDPDNPDNVIQFYTGDSTENDFNREHVWAKSHGGFDAESQDGYSDLHHMRPTRPDVNSARWHLDFDEGGTLYSNTDCRILADVSFEPRDAVKGDVARMLFYMAVRYEGNDSNMPDLELVEDIPSLLNASGEPDNDQHMSTPRFGRLSRLLQWHAEDPPDDEERRRNDVIYSDFQGNRNPFIDHPEWVTEIW